MTGRVLAGFFLQNAARAGGPISLEGWERAGGTRGRGSGGGDKHHCMNGCDYGVCRVHYGKSATLRS